jgi:hypothetical protein
VEALAPCIYDSRLSWEKGECLSKGKARQEKNGSWVMLIQLNSEEYTTLSSAWLPIAVPMIGAKIGGRLKRLGIGGVILLLSVAWLAGAT